MGQALLRPVSLSSHFSPDHRLAKRATADEVLELLGKLDSSDTRQTYSYLLDACTREYERFVENRNLENFLGIVNKLQSLTGSVAGFDCERESCSSCVSGIYENAEVVNVCGGVFRFGHPRYNRNLFCAVEEDEENLKVRMWHTIIGTKALVVLGISKSGISLICRKYELIEENARHMAFVCWESSDQDDADLTLIAQIARIAAVPARQFQMPLQTRSSSNEEEHCVIHCQCGERVDVRFRR